MTDKQIINSCEFQSRCIQYKDMYSNKHIKCPIVDFAIACRGENKCKYKTVYEQLKRKEEECEELKEAIDRLHKIQYQLADSCNKYVQTLTEIKEIAEENIRIADLEGLNGVYRRGLAKQILQKIKDCKGVEDDNRN